MPGKAKINKVCQSKLNSLSILGMKDFWRILELFFLISYIAKAVYSALSILGRMTLFVRRKSVIVSYNYLGFMKLVSCNQIETLYK